MRVRDGVVVDAQLQALRKLARHPRVMVKLGPVHGLGTDEAPFLDVLSLLQPVVEAFGAERCMWESDSGGPILMQDPERDYAASVDLIRSAGFLSDAEKDMILGGAAEGFFFAR